MKSLFIIKQLFVFFSILFLTIACGSDNKDVRQSGQKGQIYYYSIFETHNRMVVTDGNNTLFTLPLAYQTTTKDSLKIALGKQLYISFKKPEQVIKGSTFEIPNPDIDLVISNWSSANTFDLNRNITGRLEITDYVPFEKAILNLNLKMQTDLDKYTTFIHQNDTVECAMFHRIYTEKPYELEASDSSFKAEDLSPATFNGRWKRVRHIFYVPSVNSYREYFHFGEEMIWDIREGEFVVGSKRTPIQLEGNRFIFTEIISGNKMFFAINSYNGKSLTITNLNDVSKSRYVFERQ